MQITRKEIIQKLYNIEEEQNCKLGREVQKVIRNEIIPIEVIKLINKYDRGFFQIYDTYNTIYLSRNKNPLYRNLRNKNLTISETAIALSSLVTKILISCSKIDNINERLIFAQAMGLDTINTALSKYALYNNSLELVDCAKQVRELLETFYID